MPNPLFYMSARVRFSRKKLKEPDEFLTITDKIIHYCVEKRAVAGGIALGTLVLLGAIFGIRVNNQAEETRMESLLVEMKTSQSKDMPAAQIITDLEATLGKFRESGQKRRARLLLADFYYQNKQFDKAIGLYSEVTEKASGGEMSRDLAQLGLAYSYEGKKEYKKAIIAYKTIIDSKTASLPLLPVYLGLAQCYELDNDRKNALLLLREAKNKFQDTTALEKINRQIGRLEGPAGS